MARRHFSVMEANKFLSKTPDEKLESGFEALAKSGQFEKIVAPAEIQSQKFPVPLAAAKKGS